MDRFLYLPEEFFFLQAVHICNPTDSVTFLFERLPEPNAGPRRDWNSIPNVIRNLSRYSAVKWCPWAFR